MKLCPFETIFIRNYVLVFLEFSTIVAVMKNHGFENSECIKVFTMKQGRGRAVWIKQQEVKTGSVVNVINIISAVLD